MYVPFEEMPANSKVWLYPSVDFFDKELKSNIENDLKAFVTEWLSHQREVKGSSKILAKGIICLAADQTDFEVSGCSIDSSYRFIKDLELKYNLSLFERDLVFFETMNGAVGLIRIKEIETAFKEEDLCEDTPVFNLQAATVNQVKNAWIPLIDTPYSRFLPEVVENK
jgi:hypothetical protein